MPASATPGPHRTRLAAPPEAERRRNVAWALLDGARDALACRKLRTRVRPYASGSNGQTWDVSRTHEQTWPTMRVGFDWSGPTLELLIQTADGRSETFGMRYDSEEDRVRALLKVGVAAEDAMGMVGTLGPHPDDVVAAVVLELRKLRGDAADVLSRVAEEMGMRDDLAARLADGGPRF